MNEELLNRELAQTECLRERSWGKIVFRLVRQFTAYTERQLEGRGYAGFRVVYMRFIMNIDAVNGCSTNELAQRANITKQAMSKLVKELEPHGLIYYGPHPTDRRSQMIFLTLRGKAFVLEARSCLATLMQEYEVLLGKDTFDGFINNCLTIIAYNEEMLAKKRG